MFCDASHKRTFQQRSIAQTLATQFGESDLKLVRRDGQSQLVDRNLGGHRFGGAQNSHAHIVPVRDVERARYIADHILVDALRV